MEGLMFQTGNNHDNNMFSHGGKCKYDIKRMFVLIMGVIDII